MVLEHIKTKAHINQKHRKIRWSWHWNIGDAWIQLWNICIRDYEKCFALSDYLGPRSQMLVYGLTGAGRGILRGKILE